MHIIVTIVGMQKSSPTTPHWPSRARTLVNQRETSSPGHALKWHEGQLAEQVEKEAPPDGEARVGHRTRRPTPAAKTPDFATSVEGSPTRKS
jgi:hypothetical protein